MKRLALLLLLIPLMGNDDCKPTDDRTVAAQKLGQNAICTWRNNDRSNYEIICIAGGRRYSCLVSHSDNANNVNCAVVSPTVEAESL